MIDKRHYDNSWHMVTVQSWYNIPKEWIRQIKGEYRCHGHYWYFKDQNDAILFQLTWV